MKTLDAPKNLTRNVLLGMTLGVIIASIFFYFQAQIPVDVFLAVEKYIFNIGGQVFKNLLLLIVVPLVFFSLVSGISSLSNMVKLGSIATKTIGFWLLLWPGMWGLFMSENFEIKHFAIVLVGAFLTRSLGCAINDYFDIGFDSQVKRTKNRPLANKTLSKVEALICIIFLGMMCIFILYLTNLFVILFVLLVAAP